MPTNDKRPSSSVPAITNLTDERRSYGCPSEKTLSEDMLVACTARMSLSIVVEIYVALLSSTTSTLPFSGTGGKALCRSWKELPFSDCTPEMRADISP
ncbi:hypothetical protein K470DRAFT_260523 [Piedraia hortae CBS 480.64]|uniref:Uncharacterized protein n=1 Tax=Piedraia hortae CBS 480.64 TaxID=1314780 RepID=A0A6A7BR81_9PEZI|nr:hypothetical protein K470DRAFT_260523 [Piedraia hortae CBS 480.64]